MAKAAVHVTPNGNGDWKVVFQSVTRGTFPTQAAAIVAGKRLAQQHQTELRIHGEDGRIRDTRSYGPDPIPPRDRDHL